MKALSDKNYEKTILDKWSHVVKKDKSNKDLFSYDKFILQVHRSIQEEKVIVSIKPRCKHNLINVNLAKRLHVSTRNIQSTQV